jgi:hypothetical protein
MLSLLLAFFLLSSQYCLSSSSISYPKNDPTNFISYFAVCTVVKNEVDIHEWVEYHYKMGVGKFYIFDNGDIPVSNFLKDYVEQGVVDITVEPMVAPQLKVYNRCINRKKKFHQFIAFIDVDEFIVSPSNCSIPSILSRYEDYGGLVLSWMTFGSSGHETKPPGGIIANYWKCYKYEHIKSVVNTNYVISHRGNPHAFLYMAEKYAVDTNFIRVPDAVNPPRNSLYEILYLNHYHLKSREDYERNRKRGRASTTAAGRKTEKYFDFMNEFCVDNCPILKMPPGKASNCPATSFSNHPLSFY